MYTFSCAPLIISAATLPVVSNGTIWSPSPWVSDADYQWWVEEFNKLQQTEEFKKQRELRGLFEFNLSGEALDAYVKKQVNDYREQAKAFGLAK